MVNKILEFRYNEIKKGSLILTTSQIKILVTISKDFTEHFPYTKLKVTRRS